MLGMINEKHSGFNVVFLPKFLQKPLYQCGCCGRKQPHLQALVWIDCIHKNAVLVQYIRTTDL